MNTNYAEFWKRLVAFIIDAIVLSIVRKIIILPLLAIGGYNFRDEIPTDFEDADQVMSFVAMITAFAGVTALISTAVMVVYFSFMESSNLQASVGKLVLGIKVTDENGAKIEFNKALLRSLSKIISYAILCIGYIMAAFTEKKQALHDVIAKTLVLNK